MSEAQISTRQRHEAGVGDGNSHMAPQDVTQAETEHEIEVLESELIDLVDVPLGQLQALGDCALAHAIRRLIEDLNNPEEIVAGFDSSI